MVNPDPDAYHTLASPAQAETRVEGSRFLAAAFPVENRGMAEELIREQRRVHHNATHTCWAWRLGAAGEESRSDDGGEPSGTAGRPILSAIEQAGVTNVLVAVTRWFGGVKLGTGGLARAYRGAAAAALQGAQTAVRYATVVLEVEFPHGHTGAVMHALSRSGARVIATEYGEGVVLTAEVPRARAEGLRTEIGEQTRGEVRLRMR